MKKSIDCLFIGHNEMDFAEYEKTIRKMGYNSGAFRDLNLNFIRYNNRPYSVSEAFNHFYCSDHYAKDSIKPLNIGESFSAAIAYLGTYLQRRGFTFDYINSFQDRKIELSEKLTQNNILTIAIITTLYVSPFPILEIINFTESYNQTAKIIIGGPFISTQIRTKDPLYMNYLFESTLNADFYINSSQGEATLVNIIHAVKNNLPFDQINNIYYKTPSGYISTSLLREENKLSDNMVEWDLFSHNVGEYANVRTSISCPFSCSFCGFPQHAGKYQTAEVEAIERELKLLDKIKIVKSVHFIDDTFNVPIKRFKDILRMLIKNKFTFKWHSYLRCQFLDREMVELMRESGCDGVFLGIESGNNEILKNMNKAVNTGEYLKGIELLNEHGIVTFGDFIVGFPGETHETVRDTVRFIEKSGLDFYRTQLWYCEPITPIWKDREKYGIKGESFEWSHQTMDAKVASDLIEDIFLSTREPTWVPQYNFDFDTLWHLVHRGLSIDQVKQFIRSFNNGVREKIKKPSLKEVSFEIITQLKDLDEETNRDRAGEYKVQVIDSSEAEFDF
jgi:anaerobic magnesium-protoporphyrin IX monomethyl ester cyclase